MRSYIWLAILAMAGVTYCIRVLPLTLIRRKIENRFLRSFLYYVPYVTLTVMTFPAIIEATGSVWSGVAALAAGILVAYLTENLFLVSVLCCAVVFVVEMFL
ncbi:MAG: AzlD domain-containing protein [Clostridiaceae bacterium]|nr:AzlD domain-containing protein [Clostridiales bacterium]MDD6878419.1 AzlD domain-containing protein [Clostridiaceae bacterium]MDY5016445.1 AzlD domain-containing protein [Eubacteriales bacterium]